MANHDRPIDHVLSRLTNAKRTGNGWLALCPGHNDHDPSLSITEKRDGAVYLKCFAGCEWKDIVKAMGLEPRDMYPSNGRVKPSQQKGELVATYPYTDENGKLLFQVLRYEWDENGERKKDFKQRRPDGKGGWIWNLKGVQRVPYRLPNMIKARNAGETIYISEGEKCVETLEAWGLTATTNSVGAGKWRDEYGEYLRGAHVVILPDNDGPGHAHAEKIARSLHGKAASVKIVELAGLPDKGDVVDWRDAGHTREELGRLVSETPEYTPSEKNSIPSPIEVERDRKELWTPINLASMTTDGETSVDWIWYGYLGRGLVTEFIGLWKCGKTTLLSYLLKALEHGHDFLELETRASKILVVSEEPKACWIVRRAKLGIGAHIDVLRRPFDKGRAAWREWEKFCSYLAHLVRVNGYDLVIVDSLPNLWPVVHENDAGEVLGAISPFQPVAEAGAAVLLVHHPRKGDASEGQASRGSGALPGNVDIILELRRHTPENLKDRRRTLKALSRFDETRLEAVIELGEDGYQFIGSKAETNQGDRLKQIMAILPEETSEPGLTPEDIHNKWLEEPKPGLTTLKKDLERLATLGKVIVTGAGKKNDPKRYAKAKDSFLTRSGSIGEACQKGIQELAAIMEHDGRIIRQRL